MKISLRWLNEYLSSPVTPDQAEHALTFAGFPIESTTAVELPGGGKDVLLDVEVTSNRGDVLSHVGVARELVALSGGSRGFKPPSADAVFTWSPTPSPAAGPAVTGDVLAHAAVDNRVAAVCPLFTARVIKGVKVGPSPKWLVEALAAVGQRSINNVVDVTNFVALELGQPTHVFDMARLGKNAAGKPELIIRTAVKGERLRLLDGKTITLAGDEVVVADPSGGERGRAVSLAGVMGGAETEVTEATTDVLLEAATWDPVAVRRAARRFGIRTDASYRFERTVDPRTIDGAARRAAGLIARLAGGTLVSGAINAGPSRPANTPIRLRPARCGAMLGAEVPRGRIVEILRALEIEVQDLGRPGEGLLCTAPAFRPDLTREIDLIEEVARVHGLDKLPVHEKVAVRVSPPQRSESAMRELSRVLTGAGFYEALTFTFVGTKQAKPFLPGELQTIEVCDERRKADPVLRPSALPSLLACRRANQDGGVAGDGNGGVRLFETSAVFAQRPPTAKGAHGQAVENRNLALLADAVLPEGGKAFERKQAAVRLIRGTVEAAVRALGGQAAIERLVFEPAELPMTAYDAAARGVVRLGDKALGVFGVIAELVQREYDLAAPVVAAEIGLDPLVALYPPRPSVRTLPQFPSIERDLSLVVSEGTAWAAIDSLVRKARESGALPLMDDYWFVTTFRGQQLGAGKKSVTFRMRFRDPADQRTLRHEEVDPQVNGLVERAKTTLAAVLRA